jgi:hypothetical protein
MNYEAYYELAEKNSWRVTELDWSGLKRDVKAGLVSDFDKQALIATAVIEYGVPHYSEVWSLVEGLRDHWALWQFATLWTGEEHRHSYALGRAVRELGLEEAQADLERVSRFRFAELQKKSCASDCYRTVPGMLAYTVIQELATQKFYVLAAKRTRSPFLKELLNLIGADEIRHHVFYRDALAYYYHQSKDKAWYADQVYRAVRSFKMPHLIYDLQIPFFEKGDWSIGTLGKLAFKAQLVRCFSFDAGIIARLMADGAEKELDATRAPVSAAGA